MDTYAKIRDLIEQQEKTQAVLESLEKRLKRVEGKKEKAVPAPKEG
jgi:hypothetical protein